MEETLPVNIMRPVVVVFLIAQVILSMVVYNKQSQKALENKQATLREQFDAYRTAKIIQGVMLEAGTLFAVVIFLLTQGKFLAPMIIAITIQMYIVRPQLRNFEADFASDIKK